MAGIESGAGRDGANDFRVGVAIKLSFEVFFSRYKIFIKISAMFVGMILALCLVGGVIALSIVSMVPGVFSGARSGVAIAAKIALGSPVILIAVLLVYENWAASSLAGFSILNDAGVSIRGAMRDSISVLPKVVGIICLYALFCSVILLVFVTIGFTLVPVFRGVISSSSVYLASIPIAVASVAAVVAMYAAFIIYGMAPQICLVERRGVIESIRRSAFLTLGNRWKIFFSHILLSILGIVSKFVEFSIGKSPILKLIFIPIEYTMLTVDIIFPIVVYHLLKISKEGPSIHETVGVFD